MLPWVLSAGFSTLGSVCCVLCRVLCPGFCLQDSLVGQVAGLLSEQGHVVRVSAATRGFDVLQRNICSSLYALIYKVTEVSEVSELAPHHFGHGLLGFVQFVAGFIDQTLCVSHSGPGSVRLKPGVVHGAADVLQAVPLSAQSTVDGAQTLQQPAVHVCRERGSFSQRTFRQRRDFA